MKPWNVVFALEQTSKKNEKLDLLKSLEDGNDFWEGAQLALDPLTVFHVKKFPQPETHGPGVKFETFKKLAEALANRKITGNLALDTIKQFAESCTEEQWDYWYKRILSKDLRCGTAINTINAAAPTQWRIKTFGCQLSLNINTQQVHKLPTDCFIEAKYDGVRAIWIIPHTGDIRCYSRNGKEYHNFSTIADALEDIRNYPNFPQEGIMLDTEVVSADFQALSKQLRRKNDVCFDGLALAFDILPLNEYWDQTTTAPLSFRRAVLEEFVAFLKSRNPDLPLDLSYCEKGINAQTDDESIMGLFEAQLAAGFEGIMIKDSTLPYNFKKDKTWLKMKPTETYDLPIVGWLPGEAGKKFENTVGSIVCEGYAAPNITDAQAAKIKQGKMDAPEPVFIHGNVSGGISDELRDQIRDTPELIDGAYAEIMADSLTKGEGHDHYSFRFARLVRIRHDKTEN
tara:strand:+ start:2330 stop:3697 length:1368 start_codon:yes stop_codon:yes gene_type:complete